MVKVRSAFTLIEMVFAIVLIALVVAAVPQMISQNTKGIETNLKQEAIAAAAGEAFRVLSDAWDTSSLSDDNISYVLDTNTSLIFDNLDRRASGLPLRIGHIDPVPGEVRLNHRRFFSAFTYPASAAMPGIRSSSLLLSAIGENAYKNKYTTTETSGYIPDNVGPPYIFPASPSGNRSNMKMVTVQINTPSENNIITIRAYAANIGSVEYFTRELL